MCRSSSPEWSIILTGGNRHEREKTRHRVKDGGLGAIVICLANLRNLFVNTLLTGASTLNSARVCSVVLWWRVCGVLNGVYTRVVRNFKSKVEVMLICGLFSIILQILWIEDEMTGRFVRANPYRGSKSKLLQGNITMWWYWNVREQVLE